MLLSVITPTHNPKYLKDLEKSLLSQSYPNWEWVILLNNGASYNPKVKDKRIKLYNSKNNNKFVGALKKEACELSKGEVIIEIDHDDFVTSNCLEEIYKAFQDEKVGFVYSRTIQLNKNFIPYNPIHGWTYTKVNFKNNKELYAMNNLPATPGNLGYIWFQPDHVRAWRKSNYIQVGGHNENLEICDDQDLMCKLYLVTEFKEIPKPLYFYRVDGDNTWLNKRKKIQNLTIELFDKYIDPICFRFCEKNNLPRVNIISENFNKQPNESFENYTLNDLYNIKPNSVGFVCADDVIQSYSNKNEIISEIHRILVPNGMFKCIVPSTDGRGAFQDPSHLSYWNENSFWYYMWGREQKKFLNPLYKNVSFREKRLYTHFPSQWHKNNNISYVVSYIDKV